MYLFTRMTRLAPGHARDGMEWAVAVTEKVNQITSLDVGLWSPLLSPGVGSLSWGCAVETLTDLENADAKLMADPLMLDLIDRGAVVTTGLIDDETAQFFENPAAAGDVTHVAVVRSRMANGSFVRGVEVGIEIARRATALGGLPTAFLVATTGAYGGCAWITSAPSLQALEDGERAVNGSPDFVTFLDTEATSCYVEGITEQSIWRRVL